MAGRRLCLAGHLVGRLDGRLGTPSSLFTGQVSKPGPQDTNELSLEWSQIRISSTDFNRSNHLVQHNKHYHRKVLLSLLSSFHWNGHTLGFHPDSKVRTTLYSIKQ